MREAIAADGRGPARAARRRVRARSAAAAPRSATGPRGRSRPRAASGGWSAYAKASILAGDNPVRLRARPALGDEGSTRRPRGGRSRLRAPGGGRRRARAPRARDGMSAGLGAVRPRGRGGSGARAPRPRRRTPWRCRRSSPTSRRASTHLTGVFDRRHRARARPARRAPCEWPRTRQSLAAAAGDDVRLDPDRHRTWAVVGCSPSPLRDSHRIASLLRRRGYRVIPVNPECDEVLGERCHPVLPADEGIEVVDLFRRSSAVSAHVDEAIAIGAKAVWMQLGVIDHDGRRTGPRGGPARGHGSVPGDRASAP